MLPAELAPNRSIAASIPCWCLAPGFCYKPASLFTQSWMQKSAAPITCCAGKRMGRGCGGAGRGGGGRCQTLHRQSGAEFRLPRGRGGGSEVLSSFWQALPRRCALPVLLWVTSPVGCRVPDSHTGVERLKEGRMGELFPPGLLINSLAVKPGIGKVCWLQARRGPAAGDANLASNTCRGDPLGLRSIRGVYLS